MTTNDKMRDRDAIDAPEYYSGDEASAWANGFNAALEIARAEIERLKGEPEQEVTAAPTPRRVVYRDSDGDQWTELPDGRLLMVDRANSPAVYSTTPQDKAFVDREFGPLALLPASPEAGA